MKQIVLRWILIGGAALALGPILAAITGVVEDSQGGGATTLFVSQSPAMGALAGVVAIAIAGAYGWIVARLTTQGMGLFCAGVAIGWPAFAGATGEQLIRDAQSAQPLWVLSVEALVVGVVGVAISMRILAVKKSNDKDELIGPQAALALAVSFLVAAIIGWVIAREGTPGQNLAAAGIAAMIATAVGKSVAPGASLVACIVGVLSVGAVGPAAGALLQGSDIVGVSYANGLFPLARLTPLDWLFGTWVGVPIGASWAASMIEKKSDASPSPARS